jgi:hypothetical protein
MEYFYPKAENKQTVDKLDKNTVATAIEKAVEEDELTKAQAIGPVLNGSDDIETFNEVWNEMYKEKQIMEKTPLEGTEQEYLDNLASKVTYLDPSKFLSGLKAKTGKTWNELTTKE